MTTGSQLPVEKAERETVRAIPQQMPESQYLSNLTNKQLFFIIKTSPTGR